MRRLRDDIYSRTATHHGPLRPRRSGPLLFILMFVSVTLLVLSKLNHALVSDLRGRIAEIAEPALSAAMVPMQPLQRSVRQAGVYFELFRQLQQLKQENRKLKGWEWRAKELQRRMAQLDRLARVVKEPALKFVTGRVIAETGGPFVRIALINAGTRNGVKRGYPVINGDGLVGRIIDTGPTAARVLLLSDLNSRVPVMIGRNGARGILLGNNSPVPVLAYLPQGGQVAVGDDVFTSGVGGMFPRGLRIGVARRDRARWRVHLYARFDQLEYLTVLFYASPKLDELSARGEGIARRAARRQTRRADAGAASVESAGGAGDKIKLRK